MTEVYATIQIGRFKGHYVLLGLILTYESVSHSCLVVFIIADAQERQNKIFLN